jgi:dihydropteroate synthase
VTPDSFSDGGEFFEAEKAVERALQLMDEGADMIDIGGESTRPGAAVASGSSSSSSASLQSDLPRTTPTPSSSSAGKEATAAASKKIVVSEEEELRRVVPVIREVKKRRPDAVISVDTYKAAVARAAAEAGAEIVNDVSAMRWDRQMARTVAEIKCGAILMHMRGRPEEWRTLAPAGDITLLVKRELREWVEAAVVAGVRRERIALDPGFGFGKNFEQNYPLISHFQDLQSLGFPLLAGTSRKSFLGRTLAVEGKDAAPTERLYGNLAAQTALILKGAHILRTHDVHAAVQAARVADAILAAR